MPPRPLPETAPRAAEQDTRALRRAAYLQRRSLRALPSELRITLALRGAGTPPRPPARPTP